MAKKRINGRAVQNQPTNQPNQKQNSISIVGVRRGYYRDYIIISAEGCRGVIRKTKAKPGFKKCFLLLCKK